MSTYRTEEMPEVGLIAFPVARGSLSSAFMYLIACAVLFFIS